jgi:hypothetical protein
MPALPLREDILPVVYSYNYYGTVVLQYYSMTQEPERESSTHCATRLCHRPRQGKEISLYQKGKR